MEKNGIFLVTRICRYFLPVVFFLSLDNQKKGTIGYKKAIMSFWVLAKSWCNYYRSVLNKWFEFLAKDNF